MKDLILKAVYKHLDEMMECKTDKELGESSVAFRDFCEGLAHLQESKLMNAVLNEKKD